VDEDHPLVASCGEHTGLLSFFKMIFFSVFFTSIELSTNTIIICASDLMSRGESVCCSRRGAIPFLQPYRPVESRTHVEISRPLFTLFFSFFFALRHWQLKDTPYPWLRQWRINGERPIKALRERGG
jgi:hypothetical protein